MSPQSNRLPEGGLIERSRSISFTFDGRRFSAHPGDTLASALLANGVHLTGRSFKYHRPRGIYSAGPEEPNALVTLSRGGRTDPNTPATVVEVYDGLAGQSQNRWPTLKFDLLAINSLLKPFLPAGFYYKTFMWPRSLWYRLYEPMIRQAAGLGTLSGEEDPDRYAHAHAHCDVLVVGAGPAGLMAAREAARAGARVILADDRPSPGGHLTGESLGIGGEFGAVWAANAWTELAALDSVRLLSRTIVFGRYDGMTFGALERVSDHTEPDSLLPRQRNWTLYAKQFICAAGAVERPLVFAGNDVPGVMLAGAARTYVNRYGVLPGQKALVFTNNDDAYLTARDLARAGAQVSVVDCRRRYDVSGAGLLGPGVEVLYGHAVTDVRGGLHVASAEIAPLDGGPVRVLDCDLVCVSGGWNPSTHLLSHLGRRPVWDDSIASFAMPDAGEGAHVAGGAVGTFDLQKTMSEGADAGRAAARACGHRPSGKASIPAAEDQPRYGIEPLWRVPESLTKGSASFVDLQNDVTVADLELAHREGFSHAEHAKRYTTLGMATDQGKLSNVNGLKILAGLQGRPIAETGTTTFRPLTAPVALGALAGQSRGPEFRPTRHTPMHRWHLAEGAVFNQGGLWIRPYYYPREGEDFAAAVIREVETVRSSVGMVDVSTLGKIDLKGPDGGAFLDRLYINSFSKMKTGRARYGVMLREDGMVFDDGTVSRIGDDYYFLTVTTANAGPVMQHMEYCHQVLWPELDVQFCSVSDGWAAMAIAGPEARKVLERVVDGLDLGNDAFPFLTVGEGTIGGAPARILRISFSGELAYEVYTPAGFGAEVWEAIIEAGRSFGITAYGTEAMTVMRTEKGHVAGPELDGRATAADLGLGAMMSKKKDYIGRWLAARSGLVGGGRLQLVGLKPVRDGETFRMGAHLVDAAGAVGPDVSQGHVSTAVFSPECGHYIGLALLKNGRKRGGEHLHAVSPLHHEDIEVEVVDPVFVDVEGERKHA
jgi:heterotetrameric sarcosine oxidase alpha subunit